MKKPLTPEQLEKRKSTNNKIWKYGLLPVIIFVVLSVGAGMIFGDDKPATKASVEKTNYSTEAFMISQNYVKAHLNYPAESDFNFLPDFAEEQEPNLYRVVGSLSAKNAFGVKSEIQYLCRLKYLGGDPNKMENWQLVDISL
ncbi:hypothetical protein ACK2M7_12715 [Chryseobacterium sp. TY4]